MSRRSTDSTRETAAATGRDPAENRWRLGLLEYILLGLIVLGIAITVAMALFNP
jgi:hypothetical protein